MLARRLAALLVLSPTLWPVILGQDYSIPSGWNTTDPGLSQDARASLAQLAVAELQKVYDSSRGEFGSFSYTDSARVHQALVLQDRVRGTSDHSWVTTALQTANSKNAQFMAPGQNNIPPLYWAHAAVNAYRAYGDTGMLSLAVAVWQAISVYQISAANADSGSHPLKSVPFQSTCNGASTAGGVWTTTTATDASCSLYTTGHFMVLSAHLAELTKNQTYLDAALLAAQFEQNQLLVAGNNIVQSGLALGATDNCGKLAGTPVSEWNAPLIEAYSILADVTGNDGWRRQMILTLGAATHYPSWTGTAGIVNDPSQPNDAGKGTFTRSMFEAYVRNPSNTDLRTLIGRFNTVQFNALLTNDSIANLYGDNWLGPPPNALNESGATSAMGAFVVAILVGNDTSSYTPSSSSSSVSGSSPTSTSPSSSHGKKSSAAPIAIGVAVPLVVIALAVLAFFLWRRRGSRSRARPVSHHKPGAVAIDNGSKEELAPRPYGAEAGAIPLIPAPRLPREKGRGAHAALSSASSPPPQSPPQPFAPHTPRMHYPPQAAAGAFYPAEGSASDGYAPVSSSASDSFSAGSGSGSARARALPPPPGQQARPPASNNVEALPTEALVRVLQDRINAQSGGEAPPAYDGRRV